MSVLVSFLSFLWRYKVPIAFAILLGVIWWKGQMLKQKALEYAQAVQNYSIAVNANATNIKTVQSLQKDIELERNAIKKELDRQEQLTKELEQIRKDMQNVPGANDPLPAYLSRLLDELHNREGGHSDAGR